MIGIGLKWLLAAVFFLSVVACRQKKKIEESEKFFPVLSFLQSQVAHVDTSLYSIRKIIYVDSLRNDTVYLKREEFRAAASDFLSLPDLSEDKYHDRYEQTKQFDETLNRVLMIYTPLKPEKELVQRQEVLIKPDQAIGDKITNIIINSLVNTKDSLVEKRMLWKVDQSFQVTITRQLPGRPETVSTFRVVWGEDEQP